MYSTIAELTIDEFADLVREVVTQTITDMFVDPDAALDLHEELRLDLQHSVAAMQSKAKMTPAQEVAAKLGLGW